MDISSISTIPASSIPPDISPPPKRANKFIFIIGGFVILFIGLSAGYFLSKSSSSEIPKSQSIDKVCTQEAKICPDGSCGSQFVNKTVVNFLKNINSLHYRIIQQVPMDFPGDRLSFYCLVSSNNYLMHFFYSKSFV